MLEIKDPINRAPLHIVKTKLTTLEQVFRYWMQ